MATAKPSSLYAVMLIGVSLTMIDIQVTNAILPILGSDLRASVRDLGNVQTVYLSAEIIAILSIRQLIARYRPYSVFSAACVGFAISSLGCAISTNLFSFLFARFMQGLFAGAMVPIASDARFRLFPPEKQPLVGSVVMLALTAAPTFGPWIGAWIAETASWRMIFLINFPIAAAIGIAIYARRLQSNPTDLNHRVAWASLLYVALLSVIVHVVLEMIGSDRSAWGDGRLTLMAIACALGALLVTEARTSGSILSLEPLRQTEFAVMAFTTSFITAVHVGLTFTIPLFAQTVGDASVDEAARIILIGGLAQMLGAPLMWLILDRINGLSIIILGSALTVFSLYLLSSMSPDWTISEYAMPQIIRGIGFMFVASSTYTIMMSKVPPIAVPDATIIVSASRNFAAMLSILASSTYLEISRQRVLNAGLVSGSAFDMAVGTDAAVADAYIRSASVIGFRNIVIYLSISSSASAIATILVVWRRNRPQSGT